ncbi:conserved hypothetical protein [Leishmania infantum JPCM5]|uniref:Cullin_family /Cullin_protein_neddylation_domain_containing_protein_-_putative n=2 Tax=Leishmania infantum TaxID=5671 RepID=A0A6L0X546_LEIIN|nr:conserved hypothetical protein [Leishmania infantum JPCM5]CAC9475952.1 Cullin_family /Cullin_protein_neddylation_domain_containing_protein_-_putative [Leishmania infantum]CAM67006.1 conserved hypothetical protein [Leishmania infantum JPCM5]SUZ40707.1 Cullin_family /Cullin_protein_neddylation_domain_containing_protein_-_putative [Leishmania infantum]|eukprot:XP_001464610.1 conserved hypothetical protein [Leishmania infantum JPCM5]
MRDAAERRHSSVEPQRPQSQQRQPEEDHHQQHEDAAHNQRHGSCTTSGGGAALEEAASLPARPLARTPPQHPGFAENFGSMPAALLLSRSIRNQTHARAMGGLSCVASARSAADKDESVTPEVRRSLCRHTAASPSHHLSDGTLSSSPATASTAELEMPMQFESLWGDIERYLFAVYTTLQTDDEMSLRPLRTPKHRMGWYTVIYNACSGDPTKSRELYARLALLLLHILESHVLFPVLQNVDHSRVHFLTGAEDSRGARGSGSGQRGGQSSRSVPTGSGIVGCSSSGWSRFKSIATAATGGSAHRSPSKETSRNSSFTWSSRGHRNSDGSLAFMKRLFHPSPHPTATTTAARASPVGGGGVKADEEEGGAGRSPQSPKAPAPVNGDFMASSGVGGRGTSWFAQQGSSGSVAVPKSPAAANEFQTAFAGFDSTVHRSPENRVSLELPSQQQRTAGFPIVASTQSRATTSPPRSPAIPMHKPRTPSSVTSLHITQHTVNAPTESGRSTLTARSPTSIGGRALPTATYSAVSPHHARVASKTGRVMVDDEEEVLCAVNAVPVAARHPLQRLPRQGSSSDSNSVAALVSFNDTEEGSAGLRAGADDDDDDSLHTMNSFSSESVGRESRARLGKYAGEGGTAAAAREDARGRNAARAGEAPGTDHSDEDRTAEPPASMSSPFTATLSSGDDMLSSLLVPEAPATMRSTGTNVPPSLLRATAAADASIRCASSPDAKTVSGSSVTATGHSAREASPSSPSATVTLAPPAASVTTNTGTTSPTTPAYSAAETTSSATRATSTARPDERRFSLCYTFLQEWHTFVVFRSVVLSCFRYLDQYYTRRFGMDTITLMCFKVFYVVVYEPLRPLLVIELCYLMQYVREVFETTGQVAREQLRLVQETYSVVTELLLIVQSTSSSMVAQQQQQPQAGSGVSGGGGATAAAAGAATASTAGSTNTTNGPPSVVAPSAASLSSMVGPFSTVEAAVAETPVRSHASSRARSTSGHNLSTASSSVSTPHVGALDGHNSSGTVTARSPAAADGERSGAHPHVSRRRRLISLFTNGRLGDGAKGGGGSSGRDQRATSRTSSTPASPWVGLASSTSSAARLASTIESTLRPPAGRDGDSGRLSARDEAEGRSDRQQRGAAKADYISAPTVVVDLRGTVELRDRLEGHTTAHHLTTQALKQWEGMSADRRLRLGTIIKEIAKPLSTIVMEDVGNEYVAGIYAFYRYTRDARRSTEEGRRGYVSWASDVKELEKLVWRRVQLPFLHASLRSALNEVLVVEPHRSILLDTRFGLRALLDTWSASVESADLSLAPQMAAATARPDGAATQADGSSTTAAAAFHRRTGSTMTSTSRRGSLGEADPLASIVVQRGGGKYPESLILFGVHGSHPTHSLSFQHQRTPRSFLFDGGERDEAVSQISCSAFSEEEREKDDGRHGGSGGSVLSGVRWPTAGSSDSHSTAITVASAIDPSSNERFMEHAGAWAGRRRGEGKPPTVATAPTPRFMRREDSSICAPSMEPATHAVLAPHSRLGEQVSPSSGTAAAAEPGRAVSGEAEGASASARAALESLCGLFSDVTEDECCVLMAAILITKLIRDAADIVERYLRAVSSPTSAASSQPHPQPRGIDLMASLVGLVERYTDLVEGVFHNHATVLRALLNAIEELMCPFRWTRKGALQASQQRAQEALMAAASATPGAFGGSWSEVASSTGAGLPSVLLSRDARQATLPLISLAANYPQAVQQLKLSVLIARYTDVLLQHERGGGRVLSGNLHKRLRLVARLVSLLEDKDTFLEHHRLCLARRLLGYASGPAAPQSEAALAVVGGNAKQSLVVGRASQGSSASASLNLEAERQLVSFLQSYLGVTATHAFEAMLRDYEGAERTRDLFEQEAAYLELPTKIRVQLITSAQWPTYAMPPLQAHASLQRGMEVFRAYYARQHPSRTLLWVFSLGSATLIAEFVSGTKQVVASTLLATLLLVVSDAYNAEASGAAQAGALTGTQLARILGLPFHALRAHLHLLTQHRAFNLLQWIPASSSGGGSGAAAATASITENDSFSLNPCYAHKLRKIRLPLPKARPTGLPSGDAQAFDGGPEPVPRREPSATLSSPGATTAAATVTAIACEDAVVAQHVQATRRVLLDAALVRIFKSRRVVLFEDLLQTVTAHLSCQFLPSRRDVKAQLEGLIDRDYVKRSPNDPNTFVYLS